jgi:hypothetical protein
MNELFHDLQVEQEERKRPPEIKPQFLPWTAWILDADAVTYSTAGYGSAESPSACRWYVPGTHHF